MLINKRKEKFCPHCGADITDSYEEGVVDQSIFGEWWCEECQLPVLDEHADH